MKREPGFCFQLVSSHQAGSAAHSLLKPIEINITRREEVCQTGEKDKRKDQV